MERYNELWTLDKISADRLAVLVVNVTRQLVRNGAEIYRAEDTARRICGKYKNIEYVNIYATYNMVMVNFTCEGKDFFTMRTFQGIDYNLEKVSRVNEFSRNFTQGMYTIDEGIEIVRKIYMEEENDMLPLSIFAGLGSAFLTANFNGGVVDFFITLTAAFCGQLIASMGAKRELPLFINTIIGCLIASLICVLGVKLGIGKSLNIVITGAIMPFLPGVSFTNSIRDFLSGDMASGLYGLVHSLIVGAGMALGVGTTLLFFR